MIDKKRLHALAMSALSSPKGRVDISFEIPEERTSFHTKIVINSESNIFIIDEITADGYNEGLKETYKRSLKIYKILREFTVNHLPKELSITINSESRAKAQQTYQDIGRKRIPHH